MSILIVGEFISASSLRSGDPFGDGLWRFFKSQLGKAGIPSHTCKWLTVLSTPADTRGLFTFLGTKEEGIPGLRHVIRTQRNYHLRAEFAPQLEAFREQVRTLRPNLILAVGDLALWALTDEPSLKLARGRITNCSFLPEQKVLPVLPPSQVIASGKMKPLLFADLNKARREAAFPEVRRPQRFIHLHPTLDDLTDFENEWLPEGSHLSVDIETKTTSITCIGFAPSSERALVVPFFDETKPSGNYWEHQWQEVRAWRWVRHVLTSPKYTVFGQNFQYDVQYLLRQMGIPCPTWTDDTMLMHHALQIELEKGLGVLASIYSDELAWKFMHKRASTDRTVKRGDD